MHRADVFLCSSSPQLPGADWRRPHRPDLPHHYLAAGLIAAHETENTTQMTMEHSSPDVAVVLQHKQGLTYQGLVYPITVSLSSTGSSITSAEQCSRTDTGPLVSLLSSSSQTRRAGSLAASFILLEENLRDTPRTGVNSTSNKLTDKTLL